eukprot:COSAG01_NODE_6712_length_3532_cov_19.370146_4_plen_48_part_00
METAGSHERGGGDVEVEHQAALAAVQRLVVPPPNLKAWAELPAAVAP